ncbi:MAG: hypothetical protein WB588_09150 [Dehalococcoidia bacterium]
MDREVEISRFHAKDKNGKEYIIVKYQKQKEATSFESKGIREWIPSLERLETSTGSAITQIDSETFKIVSTGETVRKV